MSFDLPDEQIEIKSFWEIGQYKHAVTMIENGLHFCEDLWLFVRDRAIVEEDYCKHLINWKTKYTKIINKYSFYGASHAAWKSFLDEADRVAKLHLDICKALKSDLCAQIKKWKNTHYHHNLVFGLKESNLFLQEFKQAQKQWVQKSKSLSNAKQLYFKECKKAYSSKEEVEKARVLGLLRKEQIEKLDEIFYEKEAKKIEKEKQYKQLVEENLEVKNQYVDKMQQVFSKFQRFEEDRLLFSKKLLFSLCKQMNLSKKPEFSSIYSDVARALNGASVKEDLQWLRMNYGPDMPMSWPNFESFDPKKMSNARQITTIKRSDKQNRPSPSKFPLPSDDPWIMFNQQGDSHVPVNQNPSDIKLDFPFNGNLVNCPSIKPLQTSSKSLLIEFETDFISPPSENEVSALSQNHHHHTKESKSSNFLMTALDYETPSGDVEVRVRALYSYDGQDRDDLTFTEGDIFYMLSSEDELGWCRGRLQNGKVGLFPANYVEKLF